jgi:hypothetical protein
MRFSRFFSKSFFFFNLKHSIELFPSREYIEKKESIKYLVPIVSYDCNDLNTLVFRQIFEPAQNGNKCGHRSGGALRCVFLLANDKGSSRKSAAK